MRRSNLARLGLLLLVGSFLAAGLSRISFNLDILKLLPANLPQVEGLSLFLKHFSQPNELIVTLSAPTAELAAESASQLAAALQKRPDLVRRAVAAPPWEQNPAELSELLAVLLLNQPPAEVRALAERLGPENAARTAAATLEDIGDSLSPQEVALLSHDPYGLTRVLGSSGLLSGAAQSEFSSRDGTFRVIYVEAAHPAANYKATILWVRTLKAFLLAHNPHPQVRLSYTGEPGFVADISSATQFDMMSSGIVTLLIIALLFWCCFRRARPLLELQMTLGLIFLLSLATAGLFLKELTVIGVGFASIMIGLSVDYGYFIYQKSRQHTGTLRDLQRECLQNIAWTSGTTAAAFFTLNLSSLPGLSQLGNLVGIGVLVGAAVMLLVFAPLAMRWQKIAARPPLLERWLASSRFTRAATWATGLLMLFLAAGLVFKGPPGVDISDKTLRPRHSEAYDAVDELALRLTDESTLLSLVVTGQTEEQTRQRLAAAEERLRQAVKNGDARSFRSPLALWPNAENQRKNLAALGALHAAVPRLRETALAAGFTDEAFYLTEAIFKQCAAWSTRTEPIWPENESSRWIYRRLASRAPGNFVAMGVVTPQPGRGDALAAAVQSEGVWLVSWQQLGSELRRVIPGEFRHLILGLGGIVLLVLLLGFRSLRDVLVLLATMLLVFTALAGAMSLLGLTWNFFNLATILLLLGTGIDYAILLLLSLRRNGGDVARTWQSLGLVICLCASSAAAGFGTISWANNRGLASLGQTCALGLALDALVSLFLLPVLWKISRPRKRGLTPSSGRIE